MIRVRGDPSAPLARKVVPEKMEAPGQRDRRAKAGLVDFQVVTAARESQDTKERGEREESVAHQGLKETEVLKVG